MRHEGTSTDIDLVGDSDAHFRRSLQRFLTQALLQKLCDRLEIAPVNSDGDNGRKDSNGITPYVDHAALWFSSQKRRVKKFVSSPASTLTLKEDTFDMAPEEVTDKLTYLWHRHIRTIIAGAPRYADRLKAAGIWQCDICPKCNVRCDADHWLNSCELNKGAQHRRRTIHEYLHTISTPIPWTPPLHRSQDTYGTTLHEILWNMP